MWEERGARIHSLIPELPQPEAEGCGHIMATLVASLKDRTTTHVTDTVALDRAAGSPVAGRAFYLLDGRVNGSGPQFRINREEVSDRVFQTKNEALPAR
jgi:hypothetical protein